MAVSITITKAGRAALINAENIGTNPITIAQIGLSATSFKPDEDSIRLPGEHRRLDILSGDRIADDLIHLTVRDDGIDSYAVRSFALYLDDGTIFAIFGQAAVLVEKSAQSVMLLAVDIKFADIAATSITFGNANFLLPPATTERAGMVELATVEEARAGVDEQRAITPARLDDTLNSRFGTYDRSPLLIVIAGQSNASGAKNGGPNPASPMIKTWDAITEAWGGSDINELPWRRSNPNGSNNNNNSALAAAHRLVEMTGRPAHIVFYFQGGTSIDRWVEEGTASSFYTNLKSRIETALKTPELAEKSEIDLMIWSQGEEDYEASFATHLANFTMLDRQFRAETWMTATTPIYVTGPSSLHDRYQPEGALRHYCSRVNPNCIFVNSKGLATENSETGAGDATHFLGPALWELGYERIASMYLQGWRNGHVEVLPFYGRGNGSLTRADPTAIATFDNLVNWRSRFTDSAGINGPAALCSISWGEGCNADGNYSGAFGYQCKTDNLCRYTYIFGRESESGPLAHFGGSFGYQNVLEDQYQFAAGRGHTLGDSATAAVGQFSKYVGKTNDPAVFQVGLGTSRTARRNGLTVHQSGVLTASNENIIFHVGNDGSGSGLDADLLDGLQATDFLQIAASRFAQTGYIAFANGLKIQWGVATVRANDYTTITYPLAFSAFGSPVITSPHEAGNPAAQDNGAAVTNSSLATFQIYSAQDTSSQGWWIAIGY